MLLSIKSNSKQSNTKNSSVQIELLKVKHFRHYIALK